MPITFNDPYAKEMQDLQDELDKLNQTPGGMFKSQKRDLTNRLTNRLEQLQNDPRYTLPVQLGQRYADIANTGIFGESGVRKFMEGIRRSSALERRRLSSGVRNAAVRRLGPRSGAVNQIVANRVFAPSLEGLSEKRTQLNLANEQSKVEGLQQLYQLLNFYESRFQFDENLKLMKKQVEAALKESGGGILGTIGDVAGIIPGIGDAVGELIDIFK